MERIASRPGVTVPVLVVEPRGAPIAVVVLFPGGDGLLQLSSTGISRGSDNFMVRTRQTFAVDGFAALVVDAPSDHPDGIKAYRVSQDEAEDVSSILAWARTRWSAPIWLVGTSRGTLSAANAVARGAKANGLVLTASVTAGSRENLRDVPLDRISTPTLLIHHHDDACGASPFEGARRLRSDLVHASATGFRPYHGGLPPKGQRCGPLSFHGFYGLDAEVVSEIAEFIRKH